MSAGQAELVAGDLYESTEVNSLTTAGADYAIGSVAGELCGVDVGANTIDTK